MDTRARSRSRGCSVSPRLFGPMLKGEPDEHGCGILNAKGLVAVRDFINFCIANGVPPGVSIEWLSCHDLEAGKNDPEHIPGTRHFRICLPPPNPFEAIPVIWFSAAEPGSDELNIPLGDLLAPVASAEQHLADVSDAAFDLADRGQRARGLSASLNSAERGANGALDLIRAMAADPKRWKSIGPDAVLFGRVEVFEPAQPKGDA